MPDKLTPEQRHKNMSAIRSKNTRPEMAVRRFLHAHGYRYRLHVKNIPTTPDIVLRRLHTVILVNGCFWHGHKLVIPEIHNSEFIIENSECCKIPQTNRELWLSATPNISSYRLQIVLDRLQDLCFVEPTGKTSGLSYILHKNKRKNTSDKIEYVKSKKQEKARQKEAILRYLDSIDSINNSEARELLKLQEKDRSKVSRLFAELVSENEILQTDDSIPNNVKYKRINK